MEDLMRGEEIVESTRGESLWDPTRAMWAMTDEPAIRRHRNGRDLL